MKNDNHDVWLAGWTAPDSVPNMEKLIFYGTCLVPCDDALLLAGQTRPHGRATAECTSCIESNYRPQQSPFLSSFSDFTKYHQIGDRSDSESV